MDIVRYPILKTETIEEWATNLHFSIHRLHQLMNLKAIKVKKGLVKPGDFIPKGGLLYINVSSLEAIDYAPCPGKLSIVYEDDYLLIVDKPPKMPVYTDSGDSLAGLVRTYYNEIGLMRKIRHVHRLDVDTSGLLLIAKDPITHAALSQMMEHKEIKRYYLAKVEGKTTKKGKIDAHIGKNRHESGKMMVNEKGKPALTYYETLQYVESGDYSIVRIHLETGRTHQIRVHFASIKHPLIGDRLYGNETNDNLQLLSYEMVFIHPITGENLDIKLDRSF